MKRRDDFHLRWRGKVSGPFTWDDIEARLNNHEIGLLHELQKGDVWTTVGEHLAVKDAEATSETTFVVKTVASAGAPASRIQPGQTYAPAPKPAPSTLGPPRRRWVFVSLGLSLGFFGAHQFYAGNAPRGVLLLGASIVTWAFGYGVLLPWLWAMGEAILMERDGRGRLMRWTLPQPLTT